MKIETEKSIRYASGIPGTSDVVILHSTHMKQAFRGKGHGASEQMNALKELSEVAYEYVLCTVDSDNKPQIAILERNEWKKLDQFHSECTGHDVSIYGRLVPKGTHDE